MRQAWRPSAKAARRFFGVWPLGKRPEHAWCSVGPIFEEDKTMIRKRLWVWAAGFVGAAVVAGSAGMATAAVKYWDINGNAPGATFGDGIADGDWNLTTPNWSSSPAGDVATDVWVAGDDAVFSAGNDVGSDPAINGAFVTVGGTVTANSVLVEEGYVKLVSGTVDTGAGTVTVNAGATLALATTSQLNLLAGKVVLNGGTLMNTNTGQAGTFLGGGGGLKGLEINGIGYIGYDDGNGVSDDQVSIFYGAITGTGGTTTNGGAGTLVKIGPDQIGVGASTVDGHSSQDDFTFAKLVVKQGTYRGRSGTFDAAVRETIFGAVPLAVLPDAITLDGGGIGSNATVTLHANRGITITENGGYFDHGATAGLTIPGPLSGAGTLSIGSPTSTYPNAVTFTLSNPDNVNTFTGKIVGIRGVLQLNSSLNAASLSNANPPASVGGPPGDPVPGASVISVAAGQTFTFGSDNSSTSFNGGVRGAGTWRKVGTGTTTLTGTVADNTHTGDTRIEGGVLSITSPYLANAGDVYISTGAALNLNFSETDVIDQLFFNGTAQSIGLWGAVGNALAQFTSPLITGTGLLQVSTGASVGGLPGDYNENNVVDAADYTVWRDRVGQATLPNRDPNAVGAVGDADYNFWKSQFGQSLPGGGAVAVAVPEPTSGLLMLVAAALAAAFVRR